MKHQVLTYINFDGNVLVLGEIHCEKGFQMGDPITQDPSEPMGLLPEFVDSIYVFIILTVHYSVVVSSSEGSMVFVFTFTSELC